MKEASPMVRSFEEIVAACAQSKKVRRMALAAAQDGPAIHAALAAWDARIAAPVFVGDAQAIKALLNEQGRNPADFDILPAPAGREAEFAVALVQEGSAHLLMKGRLETRDLLRPVVAEGSNLRTGRLMSHVALLGGVPGTDKLLVVTDGGMVLYPTLEEKAAILENAVEALRKLGHESVSVAALCAIETVNPKMKESVEAAELQRMNREGLLVNCTVTGPISYDVAMDARIARHKGFDCPHCGDFDILLAPDMTCGNILSKSLILSAGARMGGVIAGARAPIVLTSRGSSAQEKFNSIALAALLAGE